MKSLKGQLLLDGGKLVGSEFHHTVVLICQHDSDGAFGLVLNRASEHTLDESVTATLPTAVQDLPLFLGGPVQPQMLSCLLYNPTSEMTAAQVLPGLRLAHDLEEIIELGENFQQIKFFAGYAGWGPSQLDNEMARNDWLTHPACIDLVFHSQPIDLWRLILRSKGPAYRLLAEAPDDVSNN